MLEKALTGSRRYGIWVAFLLALFGMGVFFYLRQLEYGLGLTGMSRDVSWGLYIAQFTFLVGIAASAVVLVLPYYLHDYKAFGKITILGEFLAIAAVAMCGTFIFVNLGQPSRVLYVMLYAVADIGSLLGHVRFEHLSHPERHHRLDGSHQCQEGHAAADLGEAPDLSVHPLGDQHPHPDGVHLCRHAGQELLAHGDHGAPFSGRRFRFGPGPADPVLSRDEAIRGV